MKVQVSMLIHKHKRQRKNEQCLKHMKVFELLYPQQKSHQSQNKVGQMDLSSAP